MKQWEEFRATFAAFRIIGWLVAEVDDLSSTEDYFGDVAERFWNGISNAPYRNGEIWVSSIDESEERVLDNEQGMELYHQLFHDPSYPHGDARYYGFGAVVVGFHSALEAYVRGLGGNLRRTPIRMAVRGLLKESGQIFDPDLDDILADLEETRHLLVHRRGVVDKSYLRGVRGTTLMEGELRPLEQPEVERFANAVWATAKLLRDRPTLAS